MQQQLVVTDRGQLESLLEEERTSLLLILGKKGEEELYHELQSHVKEPWRRVVLILDPSLLKPEEKDEWGLKSGGSYVVLSNRTDGKRAPVQGGRVTSLLSSSGATSLLRIRKAFARADQSFKSKS